MQCMQGNLRVQGRIITGVDIVQISGLIAVHPDWSFWKLSRELCQLWDWRNGKGIVKDIACRSLLRKLEKRGYITLPARRCIPLPRMRDQRDVSSIPLPFYSQACSLPETQPIKIETIKPKTMEGKLFNLLLAQHHYLGYRGSVGEHLSYLVWDREGKVLGCLLFGAAAWSVASRDKFIGWNKEQRECKLPFIANNMRFLLLRRIPHLASHLLSKIIRQVSKDWEEKYGHRIVLLETFVEVGRFAGTCYRAANWIKVGQTQGRSRNDRYSKLIVPVKDIYLYPLVKNFREILCS